MGEGKGRRQLTMRSDPRPDRYISDSGAVAYDVASRGFGEVCVEGAVEAVRFGEEAGGGVGQFFGREAWYQLSEVVL
jgi:hypothetical protein